MLFNVVWCNFSVVIFNFNSFFFVCEQVTKQKWVSKVRFMHVYVSLHMHISTSIYVYMLKCLRMCLVSGTRGSVSIARRRWTHAALSPVQSERSVKLKSWVFTEEKKENKNSLSVSGPLRAPVCLSGRDTNRPCAVGVLAAVTLGCPWPRPLLTCCWSLLLSTSAVWFTCIFWHFSL